jgi:hypothetical protein
VRLSSTSHTGDFLGGGASETKRHEGREAAVAICPHHQPVCRYVELNPILDVSASEDYVEDDMGLLSWLFRGEGDDRDRNDRQREAARKLSPAIPMAAVGAELEGQREDSETEEALQRATRDRR